MKTSKTAMFALLFLLAVGSAGAQFWSIDWWTMDGGSSASAGGSYSLTGTIGQPDAGPVMTGGSFTLAGGFWGVVAAVQIPGAPSLSVTRSNNTVIVSWPAPATGWLLQSTTNLAAAPVSWTPILPPYQVGPTTISFVEPSPTGNKFYRLHKP